VYTTDYSKTSNYSSTFRLIGQMALTHVLLLLVTNLYTKYRNAQSLLAASSSPNSSVIAQLIYLIWPIILCWLHSINILSVQILLEDSSGPSGSSNSLAKCSLCWEQRKNTACTPCGHLFCWTCVLQWLQTKPECPLCREPVQPSRIVPLLNHDW